MTRPLAAERHPRRLLRIRPTPHRTEHGFDLAVTGPADAAAHRPDALALRALAQENALLARELGRVQARCTRWRDDSIAQADRLEARLMRTRAALIAKETELAATRDALDLILCRAAARPDREEQAPLAALRVLCVGGRARQVPVYRALVERDGGHFTHVDGSTCACLRALRQALLEADLVVLQPAFACQGACDLVESHCGAHGVRCVRLDRSCARGFTQALGRA